MQSLGIYISVPFCRSKCTFCNFASGVFSRDLQTQYVDRVCAHMRMVREQMRVHQAIVPDSVDTIYLGGGTPSILEPTLLRQLFATLREQFSVRHDAEITMECAPGFIDSGMLDAMISVGVNRISFGVQSFVDREAAATGRLHTRAIALGDIAAARRAGIENINVDLIAGLPHQTEASWRESLHVLAETGVPHASIYMLEVDEDSRLGRELLAGGARYRAANVPSDDETASFYEAAAEVLGQHGLAQYEISNFSAPGRQSQHNRKYWQREPYLGFGLDAHSMLRTRDGAALRFGTSDALPQFLAGSGLEDVRVLDRTERLEEAWFLGLRLSEGVVWAALLDEFGPEAIAPYATVVDDLCELGLLREVAGTVQLTPRGRLLSNEVFARFIGLNEDTQPGEPAFAAAHSS